jgi:hypothetical protein
MAETQSRIRAVKDSMAGGRWTHSSPMYRGIHAAGGQRPIGAHDLGGGVDATPVPKTDEEQLPGVGVRGARLSTVTVRP